MDELSIDELYIRKIDKDRAAHLAAKALEDDPGDAELLEAYEAAKHEADLAHTTYLDGLIHEQAALAVV